MSYLRLLAQWSADGACLAEIMKRLSRKQIMETSIDSHRSSFSMIPLRYTCTKDGCKHPNILLQTSSLEIKKAQKKENYKQRLHNKHRGPWREHRNAIQPSILSFLQLDDGAPPPAYNEQPGTNHLAATCRGCQWKEPSSGGAAALLTWSPA
jgi:hypothetical protein